MKLKTRKGTILTLHDIVKNDTTISGTDKFGVPVLIDIDDVAEMMPFSEVRQ